MQFTKTRIFILSLILTLLWLIFLPSVSTFFKVNDWTSLILFTPIIILSLGVAVRRGYLLGNVFFEAAALTIVIEAGSKLMFAFILKSFGLESFIYLSIPLSIAASFILAVWITNKSTKKIQIVTNHQKYRFPIRFLLACLVTGLATSGFLTLDLILVKHFFTPKQAGEYALLSLIGKMIFFFGTILNGLIITFVSRDMGQNKNPNKVFYKILGGSILLTIFSYLVVGLLGSFFVPLLLGDKSLPILPYLKLYSLSMVFFTLSTTFITYHLSRQQFSFSWLTLSTAVLLILGIFFNHHDFFEISKVMFLVSSTYFGLTVLLHLTFRFKESPIRDPYSIINRKTKELLSVSICVPAYNEESNMRDILVALINQKTRRIFINKIIIICSGCTDDTEQIVRKYSDLDKRVVLLTEKIRRGKSAAINEFLKIVDDPVVVVESADTIPHRNTIENLCRPFLIDKSIGMTGGAPMPVNDPDTFLGYIIHTWWWFHRNIPRFGEIVAFRNIIGQISSDTAVDEAFIQARIIQKKYKAVHIDTAVVRNKGPETVRDLLKQRRRIFNGHARLFIDQKVKINNMTSSSFKLLLFKLELKNLKHLVWLLGGISIEVYARFLGFYDGTLKKVNPFIWDTATSTKNLSISHKIKK